MFIQFSFLLCGKVNDIFVNENQDGYVRGTFSRYDTIRYDKLYELFLSVFISSTAVKVINASLEHQPYLDVMFILTKS